MAVKLKVSGVEGVIASLQGHSLKGKKVMTGTVVYDAPHSVYVHEDLEAFHPNGQAKYLEQPARELHSEMVETINRSVRAKNGLEEGVQRALGLLFDASQELVPVDTGELRDSGFIEIRDGGS